MVEDLIRGGLRETPHGITYPIRRPARLPRSRRRVNPAKFDPTRPFPNRDIPLTLPTLCPNAFHAIST